MEFVMQLLQIFPSTIYISVYINAILDTESYCTKTKEKKDNIITGYIILAIKQY